MNFELYCNSHTTEKATWPDVEKALKKLQEEAFFRLSIVPEPETGPESLEIQSEDGNYLPVLANSGGGLREFYNPDDAGKDMVSILGYNYDPVSVTQDFSLIVRMVKEFFETGNVSGDLLR